MLVNLAALDLPLAPPQLFGREGPLVLEVGFGDGRFLTHLGRTHPSWNLLGVEVSLGSVTRAYKRLKREGITSARLYKGHGRLLVRDVLPLHSLHRVYVNFPDPWPRKKHQDRRLLQAGFFRLLSTRLAAGSALHLTTDHEPYFRFALDEARSTGLYEITVLPPPPETLQTKYALKWQEAERAIFHAEFTKTGEAEGFAPVIQKIPMQHALMDGPLADIASFTKQIHAFKGGHAVVLDAFRALNDGVLIFTVVVEELDLRQEVLVKAVPRDDGVFVALQGFGDPLGTRGLREAVRAVTHWLEGQGLTMVKSWI